MSLADSGFQAAQGDPKNLKLCRKGQWNERMLIETAFSLFEGVMGLKKVDRRASHPVATYLNYAAAIYNLCTAWSATVQLSLKDFAL